MNDIKQLVSRAEADIKDVFERIDDIEYVNTLRVLQAFSSNCVSARHFSPSNGYGYDDIGRTTLDACFAQAMFCQSAIVSPMIASGTHAIYLALDGLLKHGDKIVFATGKPYDTLQNAISQDTSFVKNGVECIFINMKNGSFDMEEITNVLDPSVKILYVQRSRGYEWRDSILPRDMEELFLLAHRTCANIITFVDNCYGEFTGKTEPSQFGADVLAGSLIKNPGGGLAPTGGYVAGKTTLIDIIAQRLTVPGMGREMGSYAASYQPFFQGLFLAPHVTAQALKSAVLFARVFELLGLETIPGANSLRSDIVQALRFNTTDELVSFCRTIQACSPIDGYVVPEPWEMPGYDSQVIMAAGTFAQGASIELSADAPIREPYTAYIQGALTYAHGKIALMRVLETLEV